MRMAAIAKPHHGCHSGTNLLSLLTGITYRLTVWRQRARDRDALHRLNDHYLQDIGLTRRDVMMEYAKPFGRR